MTDPDFLAIVHEQHRVLAGVAAATDGMDTDISGLPRRNSSAAMDEGMISFAKNGGSKVDRGARWCICLVAMVSFDDLDVITM